MLLKKSHFAHAFGGNAAGGEVGDGAGVKFDARLGDIVFLGDDGDADGLDVRDGRVDEGKKNVQVMNHDVVDDVNVQAARGKNSEAMNFKKHGARNDFADRDDGGIVALEMADLQDAVGALCGGDEAVGFPDRGGHRFFDQHVHAGIEKIATHAAVLGGGNGEADSVNLLAR